MVKTLTKHFERFLAGRADRLEHQIDYLLGYDEIKKEETRDAVENKIERQREVLERRLRPLKYQAMDSKTYAEHVGEEAIRSLNQKRDLAIRAHRQSAKRRLKKHPEEETTIRAQFEKAQNTTNAYFDKRIQDLLTRLGQKHQGNDLVAALVALKAQEDVIEQTLAQNRIRLEDRRTRQLEHFEKKIEKKISQTRKRLAALEERLHALNEKRGLTSDQLESDDILMVSNLTMMFGGLKAVNDLSFSVKKGEIFGLIGPNGAGKTTVFNCITQFYKPKDGQMLYRNHKGNVIALEDYKVHDVIKQGITRTFQNVELIFELSVLDNMLVGAHTMFKTGFFSHILHTRRMRREETIMHAKALQILKTLGLDMVKDAYPLGLPYGILKRIELARTLMAKPSLIILDEPAAGLNDSETLELAKTIKMIQKTFNTTIFLVEHDMQLVMDVCDTICAINFGKKLAIGSPQTIKNNKDVQEAYLGGE